MAVRTRKLQGDWGDGAEGRLSWQMAAARGCGTGQRLAGRWAGTVNVGDGEWPGNRVARGAAQGPLWG